MSDLVERLRNISRGDHERGCQGREYVCSCGYDEASWKTAEEAADEIERLRLAITNAQNNAGNTYQAAKAEIAKARRQAFIEAAEIADKLEDIEACIDERSIGASQALGEIATALRAKAEETQG